MTEPQTVIMHRHLNLRNAEIEEKDDKTKVIRLVASTDDAVSFGNWREVLVHEDSAIDRESAAAVLFNHDANQIIGAIRSLDTDGKQLSAEITIDPEARNSNGRTINSMIADGGLRGVSIGYGYSREDTEYDDNERTLTVRRWRLLEVSLTPIPADGKAGIRSLPFEITEPPQANSGPIGDTRMSDIENQPEQPGLDKAAIETQTRESVLNEQREVIAFARSYGIDADAVIGKSMVEAKEMALARAAEIVAEHKKPQDVAVTRDAGDKKIEHFAEIMVRAAEQGQPLPFDGRDLVDQCARMDGVEKNGSQAARYCIDSLKGRNAANKTTASFAVLMDNTANKVMLSGFNAYVPIWNILCTVKDSMDYKVHSHVGVAAGRLTENPQGEAAAELIQKEGSYNSQLKRFTGTLSLTPEGLINDPLSEVVNTFFRTGYIAGRTIDVRLIAAIEAATWTNDTTTSAALATAGNFDKVRSGFKKKLSPSGENMDNDPKILLVDSTNRYAADIATGQLYGVGTGGNGMVGSNAARSMTVVDTSLFAGTATSYYLLGDPRIVDTVTLEFLVSHGRVPTITSYDAGASGGVRLLMELPFETTVATHTDSAGNARITGMQKATA